MKPIYKKMGRFLIGCMSRKAQKARKHQSGLRFRITLNSRNRFEPGRSIIKERKGYLRSATSSEEYHR